MTNSEIKKLRKAQLAVYLVALNNFTEAGISPNEIGVPTELHATESVKQVDNWLGNLNQASEPAIEPCSLQEALDLLEDLVKNN